MPQGVLVRVQSWARHFSNLHFYASSSGKPAKVKKVLKLYQSALHNSIRSFSLAPFALNTPPRDHIPFAPFGQNSISVCHQNKFPIPYTQIFFRSSQCFPSSLPPPAMSKDASFRAPGSGFPPGCFPSGLFCNG